MRTVKVHVTRLTDKWNDRKVWVIRHYTDGHYTINQEIDGRMFYPRFQRATKARITEILAC